MVHYVVSIVNAKMKELVMHVLDSANVHQAFMGTTVKTTVIKVPLGPGVTVNAIVDSMAAITSQDNVYVPQD